MLGDSWRRLVDTWSSRGGANVRSGGLAVADQLIASATTFGTGIIIGRACTQEEFGLYMLGFSIVMLAMRLQMALISTPFTVFVPQLEGEPRSRYAGSTLIHQLGLSVITVVLLSVLGIGLVFDVGPAGLGQVVWALVAGITFILLREYARNLCFALLDFVTAIFVDLTVSFTQIAGLLVLAGLGWLSARTAIMVIGSACAVAVAVWLARVRGSLRPSLDCALIDLKSNWQFGRWIFLSGLLWEAHLAVYPWILTFFHGTAETGVWAACLGVAAVANPVLLGMQNFLGPKIAHSFSESNSEYLRFVVNRLSLLFTVIVLPIVVVLLFFGDPILAFLYGEKYSGHALVIAFLAADLLLSPLRFSLSRALFSLKRADVETATNVLSFCVLFALGLWLVAEYSVVGVALSILVGNTVVTMAKLVAFVRLCQSSPRTTGA